MKTWIRRIIIGLLVIAVIGQFVYFAQLKKEVKGFFNSIFETIEPKPDFKRYTRSVVEIAKGKSGGAGVIFKIDEKRLYILTANHIMKQPGKIVIHLRDVNWNKIIIADDPDTQVYQSKDIDLALVIISKPKATFTYLPISDREVEQGDEIYTIGHPLRFHYTIMKGIVSNFVKRMYQNKKTDYMMISAPTFNGNSGGAVVNTRGEIIGIVSGVMYYNKKSILSSEKILLNQIAFTVKLKQIKEFLKEVEND